MRARALLPSGYLGPGALIGCALAALSPALALAASVSPSRASAVQAALQTVAWDGQATITARSIDRGSYPLTYKAQFSWHATWSYDPTSKTLRPSSTDGTVTGTASRSVAGGSSTDCSGTGYRIGGRARGLDRRGRQRRVRRQRDPRLRGRQRALGLLRPGRPADLPPDVASRFRLPCQDKALSTPRRHRLRLRSGWRHQHEHLSGHRLHEGMHRRDPGDHGRVYADRVEQAKTEPERPDLHLPGLSLLERQGHGRWRRRLLGAVRRGAAGAGEGKRLRDQEQSDHRRQQRPDPQDRPLRPGPCWRSTPTTSQCARR